MFTKTSLNTQAVNSRVWTLWAWRGASPIHYRVVTVSRCETPNIWPSLSFIWSW